VHPGLLEGPGGATLGQFLAVVLLENVGVLPLNGEAWDENVRE